MAHNIHNVSTIQWSPDSRIALECDDCGYNTGLHYFPQARMMLSMHYAQNGVPGYAGL